MLSKCLHSYLLFIRCIYDMRYLGKLNDTCLISCQRHLILLPGIFHIHFISCPRLFHNQPGRFFIIHFITCPRIFHNQPGRFFISISLLTPGYFEVSTLPLVFHLESHLSPRIPQDSSQNLTFRRIVDGI